MIFWIRTIHFVFQVLINGSGSSDDLAVKKWSWKREPSSLAAGKVVGESSKEPMLRLTDLVPGKYVFSLTVSKQCYSSDSNKIHGTPKVDTVRKKRVDLSIR